MNCGLCDNAERHGVRLAIVEWKYPEETGERWASVPRCDDRPACRARVTAAKKKWPLVEERKS